VLYECLTGAPPFQGDSVIAVLAKVCVADPPRLRDVLPDAPAALEAVLDRLLAKRPGDRPADVEEIDAALARLDGAAGSVDSMTLERLSAGEQRVTCVLMAARAGAATAALAAVDAATAEIEAPQGGAAPQEIAHVATALAELGGELHALVDGSWVVTVGEHGAPKDQATRAARCALALRQLAPTMACAIGMGRAIVLGRLPLGPVIDHTIDRLREATVPGILLDEDAATLLARRFELRERPAGGYRLEGETHTTQPQASARAPFVGRARELAALVAAFDDVIEDEHARAILILASAGSGKSRLRSELVDGLARDGRQLSLLLAEGDPLRAGVPYGLAGAAFAAAIGDARDGELDERRARIVRWVGERVATEEAGRVSAFLGELVGARFPDDAHPLLKAARLDPRVLAEQIAFAAADVVRAEARTRPVLIALDDLQWADGASIALIDLVLREAANAPVLVIGLARPDVDDKHPQLWVNRHADRLTLARLSKKASRELLLGLLGPGHDELATAIADKADGNPLFVEELARVAQRRGTTNLPDAVLGTIQARLDDLSPPARKVLRAASLFGASFARDGLEALLGPEEAATLPAALDELAREDLLVGHGNGRPIAIRHALVREAAYESLTDGDRILGHRMVARWLEASGHADPSVLVEHHERGGDRPRAIVWCARTARGALTRGDLDGAVRYARRGAELGATGVELGGLRLAEANALRHLGEAKLSAAAAERAMDVLPKGSATWFEAAECAANMLGEGGAADAIASLAPILAETAAAPDAEERKLLALVALGCGLLGLRGDTSALDGALAAPPAQLTPVARARVAYGRARLAVARGDLATAVVLCREAVEHALAADNAPLVAELRGTAAAFEMELGAYEAAAEHLHDVAAFAARVRSRILEGQVFANLGAIASVRGQHADALAYMDRAAGALEGLGLAYLSSALKVIDAHVALAAGDAVRAQHKLDEFAAVQQHAPGYRPWALAVGAAIALRQGDDEAAVRLARDAAALLDGDATHPEEGEMFARQVLIEALLARGDRDGATAACRKVHDAIERRAASIDDAELRASFRNRIPAPARILALAHQLGVASRAAAA
jgi:tetratricopeptide (TPR) repeat protein